MQTAFLLTFLASAQMLEPGQVISYHDRLLDYCNKRASVKCCRASVHAMREEQARLKEEDKDCPNGLHPMSLSCPASLTWCSFRSVEEVRGGGLRGKKLQ